MSWTGDDPPEETEQYEELDEALDEEDLPGHGGGPEGQRDIDGELVADDVALHEIGADLDDPERIALFEGAMDDPDGSGPPARRDDPEAGWDVDPVSVGADGAGNGEDEDGDVGSGDPALEIVDTDATALDQVPDDAPGADSARW